MRPTNLTIAVILLVSCQSAQSDKQDSVGTAPSNDSQQSLPSFVNQHLKREFKGWEVATDYGLATPDDDSNYSRKSNPNYLLADINCDGIADFTGFLKDTSGKLGLYQIYSFEGSYLSTELEELDRMNLKVGLRYLDQSKPFYHYDSTKSYYRCGAIELFNYADESRKLFYKDTIGQSFIISVGG
jgi:hypothetical protein